MVKNPPGNAGDERDADSILGQEYSLEKEMATYSSIVAWKILWTEEPGRLQSMGLQSGKGLHKRARFPSQLVESGPI